MGFDYFSVFPERINSDSVLVLFFVSFFSFSSDYSILSAPLPLPSGSEQNKSAPARAPEEAGLLRFTSLLLRTGGLLQVVSLSI